MIEAVTKARDAVREIVKSGTVESGGRELLNRRTVGDVLSDSRVDCLTIRFEDDLKQMSIEFVDISNGKFYNVSQIPEDKSVYQGLSFIESCLTDATEPNRERLIQAVSLDVDDAGQPYVLFESGADDPSEVFDDLDAIVSVFGLTLDDATKVKRRSLRI